MNNNPTITRIDLDDPRSKNALAAERRLFEHYDLDYKSHYVEMNEPNLRLRVLEVGEGPPVFMVPGGAGDAFIFAALMAQLNGCAESAGWWTERWYRPPACQPTAVSSKYSALGRGRLRP